MKLVRPAPGLPIEQQPERWLVRAVLWGEARGEDHIGKLAVLYVIHNRAVKHDTSLKHEILRPWQFSSFNTNDPNRDKLLKAHEREPEAWGACDAVCGLFESKATVDPTLGATHYYVLDQVAPAWGRGHPQWDERIQIGSHLFGVAP